MSSIPELAAQLDIELSKPSIDSDHLLTLLQQITNKIGTPEGCEDLSDLVFDLIPSLILAAGQSKACENAVEHLLQAAAEKCVAREVYSALAAALSESMQTTQSEEEEPLGASSLKFQQSLLQKATHSLLRIKKLSTSFLREHLLLAKNWCQHCAQQEEEQQHYQKPKIKECIGEDGFCNALAPLIEVVATREGLTAEERKNAKQILCHSILNATGSALQISHRLENAANSIQNKVSEAQSTLSGKLFRFQSTLMDLMSSGPEKVLSLIHKAPSQFGINTLEDLLEMSFKGEKGYHEHREDEAVGAATAVCSSILHCSLASEAPAAGEEADSGYLKYSSSTGKMLHYVSFALNTLTDAAAQHQSIPLALFPLLTVAQYARQLGVNDTPLEEIYVASAMPIITTLVMVMSNNPIEIVRTCAYEALQSFLDAMVPQARFLVLQNMTSTNTHTNPVIAAVALQRLRLEISPAVLQPPFTHAAALQLALPWIKHSAHPPGWQSEEDVMHNADVLAAALSVLRFVLLQRLAMRRNIASQRGARVTEDGGEVGVLPMQLQPEKFKVLVNDHLKPLHACNVNAIRRIKSEGVLISEHNAEIEVFLALQRLEEVLERTIEAAQELLENS